MAHDQDDANLAAKIVAAMAEYEAADATRKEKAIAAGKLLAEAQKRHPGQKAFEKFLESAGGIGYRRATDLIAIAVGRRTFEQEQADNAAAQQRHRDKLKAEKAEREKAKAEKIERERIEREKAKADMPKPTVPKPKGTGKPEPELRNSSTPPKPKPTEPSVLTKEQVSAANLDAFEEACERCLPKLNASDWEKAAAIFQRWRTDATNKEAA